MERKSTVTAEMTNELILTVYKQCRRKVIDRKHTLLDLSNTEA